MQEEVTQKTIALVIKIAKLDANVLKAAMRMYLNHRRQKAQKMSDGGTVAVALRRWRAVDTPPNLPDNLT